MRFRRADWPRRSSAFLNRYHIQAPCHPAGGFAFVRLGGKNNFMFFLANACTVLKCAVSLYHNQSATRP